MAMQDILEQGIRFQCLGCGNCCTGEPGVLYLTLKEISGIASYLNISPNVFIDKYTYIYKNNYCLCELRDGSCVFYQNTCLIYRYRPNQCRTFPFWWKNIHNPDNWRQSLQECPGIGKGPFYSQERIPEIASNSIL